MAFLLGLIGSLGELAGVSAAEATGSAALGDAAAGAVNATVAGYVNDAADAVASSVVDTLFGKNKYEDSKKRLYESLDEAKALGLLSGDIQSETAVLQKIKDSQYTHNDLMNQVHNFGRDFSTEVAKTIPGTVTSGDGAIVVPLESNSAVGDILAKLSQLNPVYYYLVNKLLDKTGELVVPTDAEYQRVAAVYNGKGLYDQITSTTFDGSNTIWSQPDEVGDVYQWVYPRDNNYTPVPALWGIYTGISSPNNQPPLRGIVGGPDGARVRESFLDKCAFFHDIDYGRLGNFSLLADQKLISRVSQNMDKMVFPGESLMATVAVNYFSTLGTVMRKMMGSDEPNPIVKDLYRDVYGVDLPKEQLAAFVDHAPTASQSNLAAMIGNLELELD